MFIKFINYKFDKKNLIINKIKKWLYLIACDTNSFSEYYNSINLLWLHEKKIFQPGQTRNLKEVVQTFTVSSYNIFLKFNRNHLLVILYTIKYTK